MSISKLAYVHPEAQLAADVTVGPFAFIEQDTVIGPGSWIGPHAIIMAGARLGARVQVHPGAVVSGIPQDLKFEGEYSTVEIGDDTEIRECCTVNRGTKSRGVTIVGKKCLLMAYSHVAHDCVLQDNIIIGNATQLAGEVEIDDFAILSGGCLVHQFSRIGKHVMVQGGSKVNKDIPPYALVGRDPLFFISLNVIGLRRRNFSPETIQTIQNAYRILYRKGLNISQGIERIREEMGESVECQEIIKFTQSSERGLIRAIKLEE